MLDAILKSRKSGRRAWFAISRYLPVRWNRHLLTLAIETSCDDTCVAVLKTKRSDVRTQKNDGKSPGSLRWRQARLHFNEKITAKNTGLGGIHPLEALDSHRTNLAQLIDRALLSLPEPANKAHQSRQIVCRDGSVRQKPDFVSVTRGPGMRSNLSCGLDVAKGLCVAWQVPLVAVHHMQAHALTPRLVDALSEMDSSSRRNLEFPFLTLLISGGHTLLLHSAKLNDHEILASTADIAIGDALDKSGRLILPEDSRAERPDTAFGKYLSEFAFPDEESFASWPIASRRIDEIQKSRAFSYGYGWQINAPLRHTRDLKFSFSSISTQTEKILKEGERAVNAKRLGAEERLLLARAVIGTAFEHLASRVVIALEKLRAGGDEIQNLVVSGGVAANKFLRFYLGQVLTARGFGHVSLVFPPVKYCTDNAAMIAWTGVEMYEAGYSSELSVKALRKWSLDAKAEDGGILGVGGWRGGCVER